MDLRRYRKIIVFGGSFDPPHRAHVELPERVRRQVGGDVVAYIPAGRAPHKLHKEQTPAGHRLAMLRLAIEDADHAIVLSHEIERARTGRPSYTVETLAWLREQVHPEATLRLLIGADQVRIFDQWYEAERVEELAEPLVVVRPPDTAESLLATLAEGQEREKWRGRLVEVPAVDVSSTELRRRLAEGEPVAGMIPREVLRYIREHGLYRGEEVSGG
ncbi:MAG: nicotinate (nicotinamide) nucleotide adenylyltransferase [Phycisphaeraceae bacterium]